MKKLLTSLIATILVVSFLVVSAAAASSTKEGTFSITHQINTKTFMTKDGTATIDLYSIDIDRHGGIVGAYYSDEDAVITVTCMKKVWGPDKEYGSGEISALEAGSFTVSGLDKYSTYYFVISKVRDGVTYSGDYCITYAS